MKKYFDVNDYSFAHLTLTLLLHYLVKAGVVFCPFTTVMHTENTSPAQNIIARPRNQWKSIVTQLTTSCGVCFAKESLVPGSRTLTNWNDASTANGPLCVTRSLNVLSASGLSVYALAFVLEADILAHAVIKTMWCDTRDFVWDSNCQSCLSLFS